MATSHRIALAMTATLSLLSGCKREPPPKPLVRDTALAVAVVKTWTPPPTPKVMGADSAAVHDAIARRLGRGAPEPVGEDQWKRVRRLYEAYQGAPLWLDTNRVSRRAMALVRALTDAEDDALRLDAYPLEELAAALDTIRQSAQHTPGQLADADVLLTSTYVALSEDLLTGQIDPKTLTQDWHISPPEEHIDSALVQSLHTDPLDSALVRMRPQDADYEALRHELVRYRATVTRGGWRQVPAGKALRRGMRDTQERMAALRDRLQKETLLASKRGKPPRAALALYDGELAGAVARFQARHGIVVDSVLGNETVQAMNVPADYRLGQLAANLERYRWMPRSLGDRYVLVNVPAFHLVAYDSGQQVLEMKVIVGADYKNRNTPTFSDSMKYVVFRPYWNVTDSIAKNEVWPKVRADPTYMAKNDYETYKENGKLRIRQKPGPKNALGFAKFLFPNSFDIYLHDTPEGQLFAKDIRAFSHGCIRLEKPAELAQWVLGWPIEKVQQAMQTGPNNRWVTLPHKLPVFIVYFTAYTKDGQLYFGNDLYKRDTTLVQAVADAATPDREMLKVIDTLRTLVAEPEPSVADSATAADTTAGADTTHKSDSTAKSDTIVRRDTTARRDSVRRDTTRTHGGPARRDAALERDTVRRSNTVTRMRPKP